MTRESSGRELRDKLSTGVEDWGGKHRVRLLAKPVRHGRVNTQWVRPVMPRRCQAHVSAIRVFHLRPPPSILPCPARLSFVLLLYIRAGASARGQTLPRGGISFDRIAALLIACAIDRPDIFYCPTPRLSPLHNRSPASRFA